ncbi:phage terminase small subunit P27 family [Emcibacter sp. SYSU 3D8]|uniref:phage terminase small subunit P27 family n=1 Tax=Emcibacter sp. SYSU 3D8 TaxID=3133969 RepID=UPI0031FF0538
MNTPGPRPSRSGRRRSGTDASRRHVRIIGYREGTSGGCKAKCLALMFMVKARAEWRRMAKHLYGLGLLTDIDRAALAGYCQAYGRWVEAEEAIAKHGIVVRSPSGFPMSSPFLAIANKALEQIHRFGIEFGMTPASRSRVSAIPPHRSGNPFMRNGRREPNPFEGM